MTNEQIIERIEELLYDYEFVGVRVQEQPFELGEVDHKSKVWVDGDETEEDLPGLCTLRIRSAGEARDIVDTACILYGYGDYHCAIVCGNQGEYGEDAGEIILADPVCEIVLK